MIRIRGKIRQEITIRHFVNVQWESNMLLSMFGLVFATRGSPYQSSRKCYNVYGNRGKGWRRMNVTFGNKAIYNGKYEGGSLPWSQCLHLAQSIRVLTCVIGDNRMPKISSNFEVCHLNDSKQRCTSRRSLDSLSYSMTRTISAIDVVTSHDCLRIFGDKQT